MHRPDSLPLPCWCRGSFLARGLASLALSSLALLPLAPAHVAAADADTNAEKEETAPIPWPVETSWKIRQLVGLVRETRAQRLGETPSHTTQRFEFDALLTEVGSDPEIIPLIPLLQTLEGKFLSAKLVCMARDFVLNRSTYEMIEARYLTEAGTPPLTWHHPPGMAPWDEYQVPALRSAKVFGGYPFEGEDVHPSRRLAMEYFLLVPPRPGPWGGPTPHLHAALARIHHPATLLTYLELTAAMTERGLPSPVPFPEPIIAALCAHPCLGSFDALADLYQVPMGARQGWKAAHLMEAFFGHITHGSTGGNMILANPHLDSRLQDEWRALAASVRDDDRQPARQHIARALLARPAFEIPQPSEETARFVEEVKRELKAERDFISPIPPGRWPPKDMLLEALEPLPGTVKMPVTTQRSMLPLSELPAGMDPFDRYDPKEPPSGLNKYLHPAPPPHGQAAAAVSANDGLEDATRIPWPAEASWKLLRLVALMREAHPMRRQPILIYEPVNKPNYASLRLEFDSLLTEVGSDPEIITLIPRLQKLEGRFLSAKLACIARDYVLNPSTYWVMERRYLTGGWTTPGLWSHRPGMAPWDEYEVYQSRRMFQHVYHPPQLDLFPGRAIEGEDRLPARRLALEYFLLAPHRPDRWYPAEYLLLSLERLHHPATLLTCLEFATSVLDSRRPDPPAFPEDLARILCEYPCLGALDALADLCQYCPGRRGNTGPDALPLILNRIGRAQPDRSLLSAAPDLNTRHLESWKAVAAPLVDDSTQAARQRLARAIIAHATAAPPEVPPDMNPEHLRMMNAEMVRVKKALESERDFTGPVPPARMPPRDARKPTPAALSPPGSVPMPRTFQRLMLPPSELPADMDPFDQYNPKENFRGLNKYLHPQPPGAPQPPPPIPRQPGGPVIIR